MKNKKEIIEKINKHSQDFDTEKYKEIEVFLIDGITGNTICSLGTILQVKPEYLEKIEEIKNNIVNIFTN